MSVQRRRGLPLTLWPVKVVTDNRGNEVKIADEDSAIATKGWMIPQRSAKAEVPGQQKIDVIRIGVKADLGNIDLWSRVVWNGAPYDVVTPPSYHHGSSRHVRHWSIDIRKRPSNG